MTTRLLSTMRLRARGLGAGMLAAFLLIACSQKEAPTSDDIAVSIHGVNYSDQAFSYVLQDPSDKSNTGGGEIIDRFGAGGTMCCYSLPKKWHSGLNIKITSSHWLAKKKDGTLQEINESYLVDVPKYLNLGAVWVIRDLDGKSSVVISDLQPDHPSWPGKIKGWPVPSLAYQRERWSIKMKYELDGVKLYEDFLAEMRDYPELRASEAWAYTMEHDPSSLLSYKGENDPKYRNDLVRRYTDALQRSRSLALKVKGEKP